MKEVIKYRKGWAIDADLDRRPYHPVHKTQTDTGAHWDKPDAQAQTVEVLHSIERPDLTAVYGAAHPPRGLSGIIRRFAFKYSENNLGHWFALMFADRVDFIEGMFEDLMKGRIPRVLGDGYMVDLKYNRKKFVFRIVKNFVVLAVITYIIL